MEDSQIIALYFARDEQALAETDQKYGRFCFSLANAILRNPSDSEEIVSDTYLKTWQAIPPEKPTVFRMFLAKITRNLAFSRWRSDCAQKRGGGEMSLVLEELADCIPSPGAVEDQLNLQELTAQIRSFLDAQSTREQNIFLRRYFFVEDTKQIAARYGLTPDAVLRSLSRTRKKLKNYLIQEGYGL